MKSLGKLIGIVFLIGIMMSCTDIYFSEPQPKGIKQMENGFEDLIGNYVNVEEDGNTNDTITITRDEIIFPDGDDMDEELSDNVVVKKYKEHYFLNFFDKEKELWQLIVVKSDEEGNLFITNLMSIDQDDTPELEKKNFAKKVDEEGEDEYIVMNPSRKKLMKLIEYPIFDDNKLDLSRIKINK